MTEVSDDVRQLREAIREGHELLAELRSTFRSMTDAHDRLPQEVDRVMSEQVEAGLARYKKAIDRAIAQTTDAVHERFDKLVNALLGGGMSKRQRRGGGHSMEEIVQEWAGLEPADRAELLFRLESTGVADEIRATAQRVRVELT